MQGFEDIFLRVIDKAEISKRKEFDDFMENVRTKYAFKQLNWKEEGREEGMLAILGMLKSGKSIDEVIKEVGIPPAKLEGLQTQNA